MESPFHITEQIPVPKIGKLPLYSILIVFVFTLAVLQDYVYSSVQHTGFYLPESLLYNTFWPLFIPFTLLASRLTKVIAPKNIFSKLLFSLVNGPIFSFLHLLVFTSLFVLVSNWVFTPPHRFSSIFKAVLSHQLYIALFWYTLIPFLIYDRKITYPGKKYSDKIKLKAGSKTINVPTGSIQLITTDKPYSIVYTNSQKFLDHKSLKEFAKELDPAVFLRVHRSAIINTKYIKTIKSRSNGDYDVQLENGHTVRFSRHYRNNWQRVLQ